MGDGDGGGSGWRCLRFLVVVVVVVEQIDGSESNLNTLQHFLLLAPK